MTRTEAESCVTAYPGGIRLVCRVQPRASRNAAAGLYNNAVRIALTSPPVDGKANASLCAFLSDLFDVPKSSVTLVSGDTSRNKIVQIGGIDFAYAVSILAGEKAK